jgi:hypothetical protein
MLLGPVLGVAARDGECLIHDGLEGTGIEVSQHERVRDGLEALGLRGPAQSACECGKSLGDCDWSKSSSSQAWSSQTTTQQCKR